MRSRAAESDLSARIEAAQAGDVRAQELLVASQMDRIHAVCSALIRNREVAAELERPVLLFSGGKDSLVLLRIAEKAFRPGRFPFPVMHVDTGHNFPEVVSYRDELVESLGERLIVASVEDSIARSSARVSPRSVFVEAEISATTSGIVAASDSTAPVHVMSPTVR